MSKLNLDFISELNCAECIRKALNLIDARLQDENISKFEIMFLKELVKTLTVPTEKTIGKDD